MGVLTATESPEDWRRGVGRILLNLRVGWLWDAVREDLRFVAAVAAPLPILAHHRRRAAGEAFA